MKVLTDRAIAFDSIWVSGRRLKIAIENDMNSADIKSAKNEVVDLKAFDYIKSPDDNEIEKPDTFREPPVKLHGDALIRYYLGSSANYISIPTITVLPPIYGQ
ncbi:hypothetical protein ABID22_000877 [Pontibacter aydingkolensis]|uniref:Uncharacterized protein n=1 Tax=Pontibacter aydingkolensis TaxID=1911536 RepID=A0ABS7CSQ1_9BACT|nr:hypothetical protein [Pontibacter aydingkolensis]MBW7466871.1 hypothetical protein [Pontibacter aydingkolensis]